LPLARCPKKWDSEEMMMTATETRPYALDVPRELLEHTEHLPEVAECKRCGYVRPAASTLAE
jgi:hypothetical protein